MAFDYSDGKKIKGEIYISIDTVKYNANNYKVSLNSEILRVMIHGTLHLCGYEDGTEKLKNEMRKKENKWLEDYGKI
jgi:rRNA maturation RNase YbeY